jgi:FdhD protein
VIEEPLEIRIAGECAVVTMRTPGDDMDLAAGFLLTEGWIGSAGDIGTMAYCADEDEASRRNIVEVTLVGEKRGSAPSRAARTTWANSGCGLCGKATLDAIRQSCQTLDDDVRMPREAIVSMPGVLAAEQANFHQTGGIHAAGLFDSNGGLLGVREDIGRHNAVDKVIGHALRSGFLDRAAAMMVSGRLGFEIAQKALVAGVPIVASVSAPSSLAIDLANDFRLTAIGFLRGDSMNVYSHPERIAGFPGLEQAAGTTG